MRCSCGAHSSCACASPARVARYHQRVRVLHAKRSWIAQRSHVAEIDHEDARVLGGTHVLQHRAVGLPASIDCRQQRIADAHRRGESEVRAGKGGTYRAAARSGLHVQGCTYRAAIATRL
eukprot:6329455-Prymnesium_polylepis.1